MTKSKALFALLFRRALPLVLCSLPLVPGDVRATAQARPTLKRITIASAVRVRAKPATTAPVVGTLSIGVVLDESERSLVKQRVGDQEDYWFRVSAPGGVGGWVFGALTRPVDPANLDETYLRIARERVAREDLSFADLADLVAFLGRAAPAARSTTVRAELELSRLVTLNRALTLIPDGERNRSPYRELLAAEGDGVVYSEPGGVWLVRAERFWALHEKYAGTAIAERIAWEAAQNPLPGECESDIACGFSAYAAAEGRYLRLHPAGARADQALQYLLDMLSSVLDDLRGERHLFDLPEEAEYRAEIKRAVAEVRAIVAPLDAPKAKQAVRQLDELAGFVP